MNTFEGLKEGTILHNDIDGDMEVVYSSVFSENNKKEFCLASDRSVYRGSQFDPADWEIKEPEDKYDIVEILGQKALFINERIMNADIPDNLYLYDIRDDGEGNFGSIEPYVVVNRAGSLVTKEAFDFDGRDYIPLDEETSPNFLGEFASLSEFAENDYHQTGGIDLQ